MSNKTLAPSVVTDRDPKGQKFVAIVVAAYNKAGLNEEEAQRVNEASGLSALVEKHIAENRAPNEFKDEEVTSSYGYLSGYRPKGLTEQCNILRQNYSGIGFANLDLLGRIEKGEVPLPAGAEGWFAIPNRVKNQGIFGATFAEAVQKVLDMIKKTRDGKFYNYCEGLIDDKHLRQSAKSEEMWKKISEAQGNPDILIVPAQFGLCHRGRSVRRARVVMSGMEFGLGAFAVGCMLLTHPERLMNYNDLWIDCAGDEFDPDGDGVFSRAPYFNFSGDGVKFGTKHVSSAHDYCGTASGFLPQ